MTTTKHKSRRVIAPRTAKKHKSGGVTARRRLQRYEEVASCLEKKGSKSETVTEFTRKRAMEKRPFNCVRVERVTEKAKGEVMEDTGAVPKCKTK